VTSTNPYEAPRAPPVSDGEQASLRDANWALALGILSLPFCAPVTAPLAIWKAIRALRVRSSARAITGILLAGLGLFLSVCLWFLAIWQFLAPAPRPTH
jgi:hypothetical protein